MWPRVAGGLLDEVQVHEAQRELPPFGVGADLVEVPTGGGGPGPVTRALVPRHHLLDRLVDRGVELPVGVCVPVDVRPSFGLAGEVDGEPAFVDQGQVLDQTGDRGGPHRRGRRHGLADRCHLGHDACPVPVEHGLEHLALSGGMGRRPVSTGVDRLGVAAIGRRPFHAELVALGVGQHRPPAAVGPAAAVDQRGAQADQPVHLSVAERVGHEVEVEPVLHRLGLGDGEEEQAGLATVGVDDHGFGVVGVLGVIDEPEHIGPEVGQEVGRPAVDGEVPDGAGGHVRELLVRREAPPPASM